jgi:predicted PurR-regulated permease PerM
LDLTPLLSGHYLDNHGCGGDLANHAGKIAGTWRSVSAMQSEHLSEHVAPYLRDIILWFVKQVGGGALMFVQLLLTIAITAILYSKGEKVALRINRFASRVAGQRGEEAVALAAKAVRAVALGVIVTAFIQSFLAAIGLSVVGIPYVTLLTAIVFMLVVAQVGLAPVMVPVVIWLYWTGKPGLGTVFLPFGWMIVELRRLTTRLKCAMEIPEMKARQ